VTNKRRSRTLLMTIGLLVATASAVQPAPAAQSLSGIAERYFRGVYGCNPAVVEELASPDIVVTYPIFQSLFGKPALRGRDAVEAFAEHFCRKWANPEVVLHDTVSDEQRVVLVWSFSARDTEAAPGEPASEWGGISLFRFDAEGQIIAEIGEESAPGPIGRLSRTEGE
jgi:SnoaL-like domain